MSAKQYFATFANEVAAFPKTVILGMTIIGLTLLAVTLIFLANPCPSPSSSSFPTNSSQGNSVLNLIDEPVRQQRKEQNVLDQQVDDGDIFLNPAEQACDNYKQYASPDMPIPMPPWKNESSPVERSIVMAGYVWKDFKQFYDRDRHPLPDTRYRNGYMGSRHLEFWRSGLELYLLQKHVLKLNGVDVSDPPAKLSPFRVLDFGGSTGRLSRHWAIHEPHVEVFTTDTNIQAVGFVCSLGLGKAFHNDFVPPLDIKANTISLFTALSVWTHMTPAIAIAWFKEVRRILQPGGYAWITLMGDHTWKRLYANREKDLLYQHVVDGPEKLVPERGVPKTLTKEEFLKYPEMPSPFTYFIADWHWPYKPKIPGEFYYNSFISYAFIREHVSDILDVIAIYPQNSIVPPENWGCPTPKCNPTLTTGQDIVLFRKRG